MMLFGCGSETVRHVQPYWRCTEIERTQRAMTRQHAWHRHRIRQRKTLVTWHNCTITRNNHSCKVAYTAVVMIFIGRLHDTACVRDEQCDCMMLPMRR